MKNKVSETDVMIGVGFGMISCLGLFIIALIYGNTKLLYTAKIMSGLQHWDRVACKDFQSCAKECDSKIGNLFRQGDGRRSFVCEISNDDGFKKKYAEYKPINSESNRTVSFIYNPELKSSDYLNMCFEYAQKYETFVTCSVTDPNGLVFTITAPAYKKTIL